MKRNLILGLYVSSLVQNSAYSNSITGDEGAVLTDVHNKVDKRVKVGIDKDLWGDVLPGKLGDLLPEGTQVATGNRSWAQISWPLVTTRIWEESVVAIAPNKKIVHLRDGELLFNLDKRHKVSENCEVWTKLIQARVHGTTFIMQSTSDFSRVAVLEGNLDVVNRLDNSIVNIGPGVVYEVRTGAGPSPSWLKPVNPEPNKTTAVPQGAATSKLGGFSSPTFSNPYNPPVGPFAKNSSPDCPENMTEDQMKAKAYRMANGDSQKLAYFLEKIRMYQASRGKNEIPKSQENAVNNFIPQNLPKPEVPYQPIVPLADTSEFAPLHSSKKAATPKIALNSSEFIYADAKGKSTFVDELSSRVAPPLSLFRSANSATNLYLADIDELWQSKLVHGFSEKLPSLSLVRDELYSLSPISRSKDYFNNSAQTIKNRNEFLASQAHIVKAPDKNSVTGREMANALTLPGQKIENDKKSL